MIYQLPDFFNDKKLIRGLEFESMFSNFGGMKTKIPVPENKFPNHFSKEIPFINIISVFDFAFLAR